MAIILRTLRQRFQHTSALSLISESQTTEMQYLKNIFVRDQVKVPLFVAHGQDVWVVQSPTDNVSSWWSPFLGHQWFSFRIISFGINLIFLLLSSPFVYVPIEAFRLFVARNLKLAFSEKHYWDALSGIYTTSVGHNNTRVKNAIKQQLDRLHFSPPMHGTNPIAIQLADILRQ